MESTIFTKIKEKIQGKYYTDSDIMTCQFEFFDKVPVGCESSEHVTEKILKTVHKIVSAGELPFLNPDFEKYGTDKKIDDEKLSEYIRNNCYIRLRELDVNYDHITSIVELKILFLNLRSLEETEIELIQHIKIKSFMGEFEIGEKKEIL